MDDMRQRYRAPRRDYTTPSHQPQPAAPPAHVPEALKHAYQPPTHPPAHHQPHSAASPHSVPQQHLPAPAASPHHHKPKRRKLRRFLLAFIILALLAASGGWWAHSHYIQSNPFPPNIQASSKGLSLFYPKELPAGYTIDPSSISLTNGVLVYAANNGDKRLVFTLQKVPAAFDFNSFYSQQVKNSQNYDTPYGQAIIGQSDGRSLGSLTSDKTWLVLSTSSTVVSQDDMSLVMRNLKKY